MSLALISRAHEQLSSCNASIVSILRAEPWLHWAFVYLVGIIYFLCYRCLIIPELIQTFGAKADDTSAVKLAGITLGLLEDFVLISYLVTLLWGVDLLLSYFFKHSHDGVKHVARRCLKFFLVLVLFVVVVTPFCADTVLIRTRQLRFTFNWVKTYFHEMDAASNLQVADAEVRVAMHAVEATGVVAVLFAMISAIWLDLSQWNLLRLVWRKPSGSTSTNSTNHTQVQDDEQHQLEATTTPSEACSSDFVDMEQGAVFSDHQDKAKNFDKTMKVHDDDDSQDPKVLSLSQSNARVWMRLAVGLVFAVFFLVVMPVITLAIAQSCSPVVANIALNTSLNELFRLGFHTECLPKLTSGTIATMESTESLYIHAHTENFTLYGNTSLYRKTTGFHGPLEFEVKVDPQDLPNVMVIVVESFRARDSQYLVGNKTYLMGGDANLTVTPNFDRWAKRGVAFSNFWSSWRTSRALESILFAQLPYDSVTDSGITGGKAGVPLSGMPQYFKAKGYQALFTSGCRTDYDQWDKFLPSHGFDEVLAKDEFMKMAEQDFGIAPKDWTDEGGERRAHPYWGVHDDLAFDVLGNLLVNRTREQKVRVAKSEPKKPFFVNHFTISSHVPFWDHPKWWDHYEKPDFSALYKDKEHSDDIHRYLDLRYFQDLALGKFMDRMAKEGILDDTIVVIVGDHGQAPELGVDNPEAHQQSVTRVAAAIIAEGRLGDKVGTMLIDAAEQYDLLNTLVDMLGVPEEGFVQSGVGRSLLRQVPFGERIVWSNNPSKKMAAVRGNLRIEYDRVSSEITMYSTESDYFQAKDLYPSLNETEKKELDAIRDAGRHLNMYFKNRWDKKCILATDC